MFLGLDKVEASLEALKHQGKTSPIYQELSTFFQGFIDLRKQLEKEGYSREDIVLKIHSTFTDDKSVKILHDIIQKHTNINYTFILPTGSLSLAFWTMFTGDKAVDSSENARALKVDPKKDKSVLDRLEKFAKEVDKDTGKLPTKVDGIVSQNNKMSLCVDSMFLADMYHDQIVNFTAGEITGIVIHEIGHTIMYAYEMDVLHRTLLHYTSPIKVKITNSKELAVAVKMLKKDMATITKKDPSIKESATMVSINKVVKTLETFASDDTPIQRHNKLFYMLVGGLYTFIVSLLIIIDPLNLLFRAVVAGKRDIIYGKKRDVKDSDFMFNMIDAKNMEFDCDRFATLNGAGPELITALSKLQKMAMLAMSQSFPRKTRSKMFQYEVLRSLMATMAANLDGDRIGLYGTSKERFMNVERQILKTLRTEEMPESMRDELLDSYARSKAARKVAIKNENKNAGMANKINKLIVKFHTTASATLFLTNGKRDEDYQDILQAASALTSNELVYWKLRLERMV